MIFWRAIFALAAFFNLMVGIPLLLAPRREHSRKPDEFFALVEKVFPGSKLEMFSREARPGWAAWGAEPERFKAEASP